MTSPWKPVCKSEVDKYVIFYGINIYGKIIQFQVWPAHQRGWHTTAIFSSSSAPCDRLRPGKYCYRTHTLQAKQSCKRHCVPVLKGAGVFYQARETCQLFVPTVYRYYKKRYLLYADTVEGITIFADAFAGEQHTPCGVPELTRSHFALNSHRARHRHKRLGLLHVGPHLRFRRCRNYRVSHRNSWSNQWVRNYNYNVQK